MESIRSQIFSIGINIITLTIEREPKVDFAHEKCNNKNKVLIANIMPVHLQEGKNEKSAQDALGFNQCDPHYRFSTIILC